MSTLGKKRKSQSLSAAADPDALLTIETVSTLTGFAPNTIRHKVKRGAFPAPFWRTARLVRWRAADVREYLKTAQGPAP
jgi:predicted DNA-binding transcriptional regulator AlpA